MKTLRILFAILLISSISACDLLNSLPLPTNATPSFNLVNTQLTGLNLEGVDLQFAVNVSNPYPVALPLTNLSYELISTNQSFLKGNANQLQGSIPAGGSQVINLPVHVGFAGLMKLISGVKPGGQIPYTAKLNLSVDAGAMGPLDLPIETSGAIPIPDVPEISVETIDWQNVSLTNAKAVMKLKVKNTNSFQMGLDKINYAVNLEGSEVAKSQLNAQKSLATGESGIFEIPIEFRPLDLGMGVFNMLKSNSFNYTMNGNMNLTTEFGNFDVPLDLKK
jgi:LEA14-like dessication related protein